LISLSKAKEEAYAGKKSCRDGDRGVNDLGAGSVHGGTFEPFKLDQKKLIELKDRNFNDFVADLYKELREFTEIRTKYYNELRDKISRWMFPTQKLLAIGGAIAVLLTAVAAVLPDGAFPSLSTRGVLVVPLIIYAVIGAIIFYERATDRTGSYFRYVLVILSMRDLRTKLEFEVLKELEKVRKSPGGQTEEDARAQLLSLAEGFCLDIDKATMSEATEWRTAFQTSLGALEDAAKKGSQDILKQIEENRKAAEEAAAKAQAAADLHRPGYVNLSIAGKYDGHATVLIDEVEKVKDSPSKDIALVNIPIGPRTILVRVNVDNQPREVSKTLDVKPGVQTLDLPV
jgi:hypothetical protein